jgi:uncharacterized protein YjbI with pentapeptide repeats
MSTTGIPHYRDRRSTHEQKPKSDQSDAKSGRLQNAIAILGIVFVALGLVVTGWADRNTQMTAEQGQITDRFSTAVGQLGSGNLDIRVGGVYALQRVMTDSSPDQVKIIEVLCAFARGKTAPNTTLPQPSARPVPTDIQAALTVIGTRNTKKDDGTALIDLDHAPLAHAQLKDLQLVGANLVGANLADANLINTHLAGANLADAELQGAKLLYTHLKHANLTGAKLPMASLTNTNLTNAVLAHANLTGAVLSGATLTNASFFGATLTNAKLNHEDLPGLSFATATLTGADLTGAKLTTADFTAANLTSARLANANLAGASFFGANLTHADLRQAILTGANFTYATLIGANFAGANLIDSYWPPNVAVPEGWQRNPHSGRLERAGH